MAKAKRKQSMGTATPVRKRSRKFMKLRLRYLLELKIEPIEAFRDAVEEVTTRYLKNIERESKKQMARADQDSYTRHIISSSFDEDLELTEAMHAQTQKSAIVALYSHLEIRSKTVCMLAIPEADEGALFKWADLKTTLNRAGIELHTLKSYAKFNELRCLTNSIKHSDKIDNRLKGAGWPGNAGDPVSAKKCGERFPEYAQACREYFGDLCAKLLTAIDNGPSTHWHDR
jgi:hypothetical protein